MGLQFYKPNKANKGYAASFSFAAKANGTKAIFAEFVKQNGWNQEGRGGQGNGIFKDGKKIVIKLSTTEAATIIDAIERREDTSQFFHTSEKGSTTINFKRYAGKVKEGNEWVTSKVPTGYAFSVSAGATEADRFGITLTFGEAKELAIYLGFALEHLMSAVYAEEKAKAKEYFDKKDKEEKAEPQTDTKAKGPGSFLEKEEVTSEEEDSSIPF